MNKLNFKCYDSPFADRLRTLMEENNTKQNIIAELLGVTRQSVSQYCDGTSLPPIDKIITLANYYNVSTDYILGLSEHPTTDTDLKSVCEYMGLNEKTIQKLCSMKKTKNNDCNPSLFFDLLIDECSILAADMANIWLYCKTFATEKKYEYDLTKKIVNDLSLNINDTEILQYGYEVLPKDVFINHVLLNDNDETEKDKEYMLYRMEKDFGNRIKRIAKKLTKEM